MIHPARRLWQHVEVIHAVTYFAPEVADGLAAAGLRGWWRGYFAARAAPLGPVGPAVVQALFYGFAPELVARCLPSAWEQAGPARAIEARDAAVAAALGRLGVVADERTAALAEQAAAGAESSLAGRALYAGHLEHLAGPSRRPADPTMRLWWACTLLREHRGDGHNAVLAAGGIDGCMANQLAVLDGVVPAARQQEVRGWSDEEWAAAGLRVVSLPPGTRTAIEARTDELARGPVDALGITALDELCDRLAPFVEAIVESGTIGYPNPVGLTARGAGTEAAG